MNGLVVIKTSEGVIPKSSGIVRDFSTPEKSFATQRKAVLVGDLETFKTSIDPDTINETLQEFISGKAKPNVDYFQQISLSGEVERQDDLVILVAKRRTNDHKIELTYHKHDNNSWLLSNEYEY